MEIHLSKNAAALNVTTPPTPNSLLVPAHLARWPGKCKEVAASPAVLLVFATLPHVCKNSAKAHCIFYIHNSQ